MQIPFQHNTKMRLIALHAIFRPVAKAARILVLYLQLATSFGHRGIGIRDLDALVDVPEEDFRLGVVPHGCPRPPLVIEERGFALVCNLVETDWRRWDDPSADIAVESVRGAA